jgi:hypothetical protein
MTTSWAALHEDTRQLCGSFDRIFANRWWKAPQAGDLTRVLQIEAAFAKSLGDNVRHGVIISMDEGVSMRLDGAVREEANTLMSAMKTQVAAMVFVLRDGGFRAAAIRSAILGLQWVSSPGYPSHVERDVSEGARWLVTELARQGARLPLDTEAILTRELTAPRS